MTNVTYGRIIVGIAIAACIFTAALSYKIFTHPGASPKPIARGAANQTLLAMREQAELVTAVSATRPSGAGAGVDVTSWRQNGLFGPPLAAVFLDGSAAQTLSSPTGGTSGVELWGYVKSEWWLIGYLNNGTSIDIVGATQGFAQEMQVMGIFERLAVAATMSAGTCNARLFPIDHWQ